MYQVTGQAKLTFDEPIENLRDVLNYAVRTYGDHTAYRFRRQPGGDVLERSYRQTKADIDAFGTGLMSLSETPGQERIVTIGANAYEWVVSANAALFGAGLSIPIDRQLPASEVLLLTRRSRATIFVYHHGHTEIAAYVAANNPAIRHFILMKEAAGMTLPDDPRFMLMDDICRQGQTLLEQGDTRFTEHLIDTETMAALIFTSGTTSAAKGVMLSHRNIAANVVQAMRTLKIRPGKERAISVLPLHHTFENTVGIYMFWAYGVTICFMDGLRYLSENLREHKITMIISVPLLVENIYRQIIRSAEKKGKLKTINRLIPILNMLQKIGLDLKRRLFHEIHDALGGELWLSVVGAAAVDRKILEFFNGIGITCWAGYGLTEASPVVAACSQDMNILGSVGRPLAGITCAIDDPHGRDIEHAGEILVKGDNVMLGYFENDEATQEVLVDGWLRTGDIGYFDEHDCLFITGRAKSMIVFANGKKAFPEEIETLLNHVPGVAESMVWGELNQREDVDVAALIKLDRENLPVTGEDAIRKYLLAEVAKINAGMPVFRHIKHMLFTEDDLVKTTTLKVRRSEQQQIINAALADRQTVLAKCHGYRLKDGRIV
ncbi:MAG TPA: AMP-binding protein [Clostridiaceae bacterium]|nr:AMP-binding protein [Clostridiaceae bacterium]